MAEPEKVPGGGDVLLESFKMDDTPEFEPTVRLASDQSDPVQGVTASDPDLNRQIDESARRRRLGKELCEAAADGDLQTLEALVTAGADPSASDYDKRSAMHLACAEGKLEIVKFLISKKANINARDRWGGYPLKEAVFNGHDKVRDLLMAAGARIDPKDEDAIASELCKHAGLGQLEDVQRLVECKANINAPTSDRRTALHLAAAEGHLETVKYLVDQQADLQAKDRWNTDPLKDAMRAGHSEVIKFLRSHGAKGEKDDHSDHGMSMGEKMCAAACRGDIEQIKTLVAKGASVNAADYDNRSALHLSAAEGHEEVVAFLVIYGANVNAKDRWGGDALKDAIRGGHNRVQEILREAGARGEQDDHSDHKDHGDRMCNAAAKGDLAQIKKLHGQGISVSSEDYDKRSALHIASAEGYLEVVQFLIDNKAEVNHRDRFGGTPLKDAIRGGHRQVQQALMEGGAGAEEQVNKLQAQIELDTYQSRPLHLRAKTEQWSIDRNEVKMGKLLGEGQQGYVLRADWRGMPVVCKVLKNRDSHVDELDFINEIAVLSHVRHPNLVLFLGAALDAEPKIIVSEYLDGGSVEDMYEKRRVEKGSPWHPPVHIIHRWSIELARALCFLHNCDPVIIHRDVKPCNLLLTAEGHLKVSDFGLSKIYDAPSKGTYTMTGVTGTIRYMAPEVMRSEPYCEKVDVYSYGSVLFYMCTGEKPLDGKTQQDFLFAAQRRQHLLPDVTQIGYRPLADMMFRCWDGIPAARPSAGEIVERLDNMKLPNNPKQKAAKRSMSARTCRLM